MILTILFFILSFVFFVRWRRAHALDREYKVPFYKQLDSTFWVAVAFYGGSLAFFILWSIAWL